MPVLESVRAWARRLKRDAVALWFASRNPRTPLLAKIVCVIAVAYALSPIDLILDFIPVLGACFALAQHAPHRSEASGR